MIGYGCYSFHASYWHAGQYEASQHALFVMPTYRARVGLPLIRFIEDALKREGAVIINQNAHVGEPVVNVFEGLGYTIDHIQLGKRLR